jgi:energy-coupling factor transporter transmembrane protein EcfT
MARIVFHYFPGDSFLHRWDTRCKFFGFLLITGTLIQTSLVGFIFHSLFLTVLLFLSRLPLRWFLRDFKWWAVFLFLLFLFQIFLTPEEPFSFAPWLPVNQNGLLMAGQTCWQMGLLIGYAVLFTAVTRPRDLGQALVWILKPLPFIPENRISLMVSLTLKFFPRILDQAEEVNLAHRARLGDQKRNPFRKAKFLILPIFRRSIFEAEEVAFALAARGYRDDLPARIPKLPLLHLLPLFLPAGVWLFLNFV